MKTLYVNAYIVTGVPGQADIPDGDILVDEGTIEYVGPHLDISERGDAAIVDASRYIVTPGLINAHGHSMSNLLRVVKNGVPLEVWRQYVKAGYRWIRGRALYVDTMIGLIDLLRHGVTTTIDHFTDIFPFSDEGAPQAIQAMMDSGIRGVFAPMVSDVSFEKTVLMDRSSLSEAAAGEVAKITRNETASGIPVFKWLADRYHGKGRITLQLGPAAPHRCSRGLLKESLQVSREFGVRLHMHVLETRMQKRLSQQTFGKTAIQYLREVGFLVPELTMAHCIWVEPEDIRLIADSGASAAWNPVSNTKLGDGIAPANSMMAAGVNVGLGTDGPCSNDSQNMFETVKFAACLSPLQDLDYRKWLSSRDVFRMATVNGARSVGLEGRVGSLAKGRHADMLFFKRHSVPFKPLHDPVDQLVFCHEGEALDRVFVAGEEVVSSGRLTRVDEDRILREAAAFYEEIRPHLEREFSALEEIAARLGEPYIRLAEEKGGGGTVVPTG